ncbi:MAG: hypothetical protein SOX92_03280 [Candidatus Onthovivens sp.]|nr:hypothetical protein [Candidatus Onthovivens sp.]
MKAKAQEKFNVIYDNASKKGDFHPTQKDVDNVSKWAEKLGALKGAQAPLKGIKDNLKTIDIHTENGAK